MDGGAVLQTLPISSFQYFQDHVSVEIELILSSDKNQTLQLLNGQYNFKATVEFLRSIIKSIHFYMFFFFSPYRGDVPPKQNSGTCLER